jgi:GH43 family beta-xylosidase
MNLKTLALLYFLLLNIFNIAAAQKSGLSTNNKNGIIMNKYKNPIGREPFHIGDPFIYFTNNKYYLTGTTDQDEGFRIWSSENLMDWNFCGWAYKKTEKTRGISQFWAPEIKKYHGKYYLTYSAKDKELNRFLISLAVSDSPEGPFEDIYAPWFDFGYAAIDGHIFVDDDERVYLYFSRNGHNDDINIDYGIIYGVELEKDLSKPIGQPVMLFEANQKWEIIRDDNRCNEGPTVIKHKSKYYMTYSANNTCYYGYAVGYAVSDLPLGNWSKPEDKPILDAKPEIGVTGPGHNSLFLSPDGREMFIVYHTHADPKNPSDDRVVNIDRIIFDDSGKLKVIGPTRDKQELPSKK